MNISQPVATSIGAVKFGILTSEEIKSLSVKQISNPNTIDVLLHPIPGGLYDLALGAFQANPCATCHLTLNACPGHPGHIVLPVFVYHCVFMDQAYRLLRATCIYCKSFRLPRVQINRYICKLQLIRHGLLTESAKLDDIGEGSEEEGANAEDIMERRNEFVKKCIKKAGGTRSMLDNSRTEVVAAVRRELIEAFQKDILKTRRCQNCKAYSPMYRKNKYTSIFRKPLNKKEQAANAQNSIRAAQNPLVELMKSQVKREHKLQRKSTWGTTNVMEIDEGVADMGSSPEEEMEDPILIEELSESLESESAEEEEGQTKSTGDKSFFQTEASKSRIKKKSATTMKEDEHQVYVNVNEVRATLVHIFQVEREILGLIYGPSASADMFFISHLLVPPNKYRREQKQGPDEITESPDNEAYKNVLTAIVDLDTIRREVEEQATNRYRLRTYDDLQRQWLILQDKVNSLLDSDKNPTTGQAALRMPEGIKQRLEKKEGMFRMNIMGKRVNFAARSVISPDPNIETNEIGVPPVFARKLTYPEPVTSHNFDELKQAVMNGPNKWPGAAAIEYENGQVINLVKKTDEERQAIANLLLAPSNTGMTGVRNKKVHRHLNNGDIVIMNRQPTLHKPSMMAHRARILPGEKTIRMHYANCNTYNADFDGDEMNMHFPQNEIARAEALGIADTDHQYLSATAGQPLRGLIQDHISMGVWLTCMDTFFTREEYQELLYSSLRPENGHTTTNRVITLPPAIRKPRARWTGKQVVDTVLANIKPKTHVPLHLISKSQTAADRWGPDSQEQDFRIISGELVTGILDKKQIGPAAGGLVHTVYEAYGHTVAGKLLSILGRLLTKLLHMRAFSCGVEDLILTEEGNRLRKENLAGAQTIGLAVAAKYVTLTEKDPKADDRELMTRLESVLRDESKQAGLDTVMNGQTAGLSSDITRACLPNGLVKPFPKNQMQAMTTSGAKGSNVNANLISCNLGQQVLEGRRVPVMISGKTLPSFRPFESSIRAGGYIVDRFLTGVRPQEYFFHAMAGREGLIDTAVKTSRSGYLQRCLGKGLEGLRVDYDTTVRDSDGSIIQTLYGEDGLDITRSQSLMDFEFLSKNFLSLYEELRVRDELEHTAKDDAIEWSKSAMKEVKKAAKTGKGAEMDPAISHFPPGTYAGSVSEKFYSAAKKYVDENPDKVIRTKENKEALVTKRAFMDLLHVNYLKAVIQPGEAIGVVAAQSIGEPSTQMTLNTFHLAGHSAKNVTLGIPRLREILMTASRNLKTPTMTLYPIEEIDEESAKKFAKGISRLSLAEVIDHISVEERMGEAMYLNSRIYDIRLTLFPAKEYKKEYEITIDDVVSKIEKSFLPKVQGFIKAEIKRRNKERSLEEASDAHPDVGIAHRVAQEGAPPVGDNVPVANTEGGDSDNDNGGDDDATDAKQRANLDEGATYEDADESDEEIEKRGQREADEAEDDNPAEEDETYGSGESNDEADVNSSKENLPKYREDRIKSAIGEVTHFSFDDKHGASCSVTFQYDASTPKMLVLPLVIKAAHQTLIQQVGGLGSCVVIKDDDKVPALFTEGVNLLACRDYQNVINPNRIFTNDVGAMLDHYGVEAARATIIRELRAVFEGHSIKVDLRHLILVADYMTRGGGFAAFSRTGMRDKRSAFAKMSFETTIGFMRDAVFDGDTEDLRSPSARITVGKVGRVGTGMCDVMMAVA